MPLKLLYFNKLGLKSIYSNNVFSPFFTSTNMLPLTPKGDNAFKHGPLDSFLLGKNHILKGCSVISASILKGEAEITGESMKNEGFKEQKTISYSLDGFTRSNQDTCLVHRPVVSEGQWVQAGDLLADCSSSVGGELSIGQNLLIAYMPWEGYNYEDAILISERLVFDDLYTSVHIEKYELETRETKLGKEEITREIPYLQDESEINNLDQYGIVKVGSWVQEGDILVGKTTPINKKSQSPYQKLLYTILEKDLLAVRDSSLRAPKGIRAKIVKVQLFKNLKAIKSPVPKRPKTKKTSLSQINPTINYYTLSKPTPYYFKKGGRLSKKKIKSRKVLTIKKYFNVKTIIKSIKKSSKFSNNIPLGGYPLIPPYGGDTRGLNTSKNLKLPNFKLASLQDNTLIKYNYNVYKKRINNYSSTSGLTSSIQTHSATFIRKKVRFTFSKNNKNQKNVINTNLLTTNTLTNKTVFCLPPLSKPTPIRTKNHSLGEIKKFNTLSYFSLEAYTPRGDKKKNPLSYPLAAYPLHPFFLYKKKEQKGAEGLAKKGYRGGENKIKTDNKKTKQKSLTQKDTKKKNKSIIHTPKALFSSGLKIHLYLAEKRKVQVGDKLAGRHGNKGIISQILPREDMPYLPDGTPIDMVLNPLGVPSRMNVGQIYECLLGLAGKFLGENYKVFPFDEIYGPEASRSFVYSKLNTARLKTGLNWLFEPNTPGKIRLYDGRTGDCFDQAITVGQAYILRLVHMVDDKIHARSTGPYSLVTQQPLRGRSKQGGQRLGEMEVWALEGYGAAFTLLEMLTIKSDDMTGRMTLWSNLILNSPLGIGTPESFKVLICELQALCLDIGLFRISKEDRQRDKTFLRGNQSSNNISSTFSNTKTLIPVENLMNLK